MGISGVVRRALVWARALGLTLVIGVAWLAAPGVAFASVTIGFDDLDAGTQLGGYPASRPVVQFGDPVTAGFAFGGPSEGKYAPELCQFSGSVFVEEYSPTHSEPNYAKFGLCPVLEGSTLSYHGSFGTITSPVGSISAYVGSPTVGDKFELDAYDQKRHLLGDAEVTTTTTGPNNLLEFSTGAKNIKYFGIYDTSISDGTAAVGIDDLSLDPCAKLTCPPALKLTADSGLVQLTPSHVAAATGTEKFTMTRLNGSTGPVNYSVTGLPPGVTYTVLPPTSSASGDQAGSVVLTAPAGTTPAEQNATLTASPLDTSTAGPAVSTMFPVEVNGTFDLRAQGIEITQGITNTGTLQPTKSGLDYPGLTPSPPELSTSASSGPDSGYPDEEAGLPNGDSPLVAHNLTVVRFYADAHFAPEGVPGVVAQLYGYRNGAALPGNPIYPDYGPANLPDTGESDPALVMQAERVSDANAFTFTLPTSWTEGTINLVAKVTPPIPRFVGPQYTECGDPSCAANNSFALDNITFSNLPTTVIAPLKEGMPGDAAPPPSSATVFQRALQTEPGANQFEILPYVASIDPTPEVKQDDAANSKPFNVTQSNPCPGQGYTCNQDHNTDYGNAVSDWENNSSDTTNGYLNAYLPNKVPADIVFGVNTAQRGVTLSNILSEPLNNPVPDLNGVLANALVDSNRPITSVGHEWGHTIGRNHADDNAANGRADGSGSTGCGGGGGPWPPDGQGELQGIGLETDTYPYRILFGGLPNEPTQWYDKMSYCAGTDETPPAWRAWISPFGWMRDLSELNLFGQRKAAAGDAGDMTRAAEAAVHTGLLVTATIRAGGTGEIDSAIPGSESRPPSASPFHLVARNASGRMVTNVPMSVFVAHDDPGPSYLILRGTVPASVNSVQVVNGATVVAHRTRSRHRPRIRILSPNAHAVVGRRRLVSVRWKARGSSTAPLQVEIAYSTQNGRDWHGIFLGPNTGTAKLPRSYFGFSRHARIRIEVNDGFNNVVAVSKPFVALGSPPTAAILDPSGDSDSPTTRSSTSTARRSTMRSDRSRVGGCSGSTGRSSLAPAERSLPRRSRPVAIAFVSSLAIPAAAREAPSSSSTWPACI